MTLCCHSFLWWGKEDITHRFTWKGRKYIIYGLLPQINTWITHDAKPKIVDARLTLIFRMRHWPWRLLFCLWWQPTHWLGLTANNSLSNYLAYMTKNCWHSVDAHFNVVSSQYLRPSITVWMIISTQWWHCSDIETQPFGKSEPGNRLAQVALILSKMWYRVNDSILPLYLGWWTKIHLGLLKILADYFSEWNSQSSNI